MRPTWPEALLEKGFGKDLKQKLNFENDPIPGHCIHEMGGVRMGRDPKTSVLNGFNQCHDVDNVFATDGSAFASIACQNPSLTFMALTARAADYAAQQMKEGTLA